MERPTPASPPMPTDAEQTTPPSGAGCRDDGPLQARGNSTVRRLPPLIALSYFEAAARTGSFAEAAKQLHVSPAAVSHQVKALETQLGVELFVRQHRKVILTRAAAAVLPRLQEGFAALAEAVEQLRAHDEDQAVVTVCAEPLFATKWLVPRLHRFYARCPEAEVRLQASLSSVDSAPGGPVTVASFRRAGIDLSVRLGYGRYADLHATPLLDLDLVPLCAPALLPRLATPADLLAVPLLSDSTLLRSAERFGWSEWLCQAGVPLVAPLREQRFGNGLLALEAAATAQGVLLASATLTQAERDAGKLAVAFPQALHAPLAYHLVCPPAALERPIVAAFRAWLLAEMTDIRDGAATAKAPPATAAPTIPGPSLHPTESVLE